MIRVLKSYLLKLFVTIPLVAVIAAFFTTMSHPKQPQRQRFTGQTIFKCPNNEFAYISPFESQAYGCMTIGDPGQILVADPFSKTGMRWIYPIDMPIN
jgi:hypothetical protein